MPEKTNYSQLDKDGKTKQGLQAMFMLTAPFATLWIPEA